MFSIQHVKQERLMDDGYSSSGMSIEQQKADLSKKILQNEISKASLLDQLPISKHFSTTVGVGSSALNKTIILHDKIITGDILKTYPTLSFTDIKLYTNSQRIRHSYLVESKTLEFEISGLYQDIKSFFVNELNYTEFEFENQSPSNKSQALEIKNEYYNIEMDKNKVQDFLSEIKSMISYHDSLKFSLNKKESRLENSFLVKTFNKDCILHFSLKGFKCELDFCRNEFNRIMDKFA